MIDFYKAQKTTERIDKAFIKLDFHNDVTRDREASRFTRARIAMLTYNLNLLAQ